MDKTYDKVSVMGIIIILAVSIGFYGVNRYKADHKVTCATSTISFDIVKQESDTLNKGETKTVQAGENGILTTCKNNAGYKSEKVEKSAMPQIDIVGSKLSGPYIEPPQNTEEADYGSVCNDGWHSPSVGRGACSWHGGVAY